MGEICETNGRVRWRDRILDREDGSRGAVDPDLERDEEVASEDSWDIVVHDVDESDVRASFEVYSGDDEAMDPVEVGAVVPSERSEDRLQLQPREVSLVRRHGDSSGLRSSVNFDGDGNELLIPILHVDPHHDGVICGRRSGHVHDIDPLDRSASRLGQSGFLLLADCFEVSLDGAVVACPSQGWTLQTPCDVIQGSTSETGDRGDVRRKNGGMSQTNSTTSSSRQETSLSDFVHGLVSRVHLLQEETTTIPLCRLGGGHDGDDTIQSDVQTGQEILLHFLICTAADQLNHEIPIQGPAEIRVLGHQTERSEEFLRCFSLLLIPTTEIMVCLGDSDPRREVRKGRSSEGGIGDVLSSLELNGQRMGTESPQALRTEVHAEKIVLLRVGEGNSASMVRLEHPDVDPEPYHPLAEVWSRVAGILLERLDCRGRQPLLLWLGHDAIRAGDYPSEKSRRKPMLCV